MLRQRLRGVCNCASRFEKDLRKIIPMNVLSIQRRECTSDCLFLLRSDTKPWLHLLKLIESLNNIADNLITRINPKQLFVSFRQFKNVASNIVMRPRKK